MGTSKKSSIGTRIDPRTYIIHTNAEAKWANLTSQSEVMKFARGLRQLIGMPEDVWQDSTLKYF